MTQPPTTPGSSKMVAVEEQMYDGTWRVRIRTQRRKFDDEAKARFLEHYAETGRKSDSAKMAGVTVATVWKHVSRDQEFAQAVLAAEEEYRDKVIAHVQKLVFDGQKKVIYDRQGNIVSEEEVYPIPLIQMEARRVEEGYRDKREMDLKIGGGVLVAPAEVKNIDDWEAKFANKTIEGEAQEVKPED